MGQTLTSQNEHEDFQRKQGLDVHNSFRRLTAVPTVDADLCAPQCLSALSSVFERQLACHLSAEHTTLQALCTHPTDTFQTLLIRPNYPSQLQHSLPRQSFFLLERVRVESYKPSFLLENLCLQELNGFSNVKQNSFRKWADFQRNCQKVTRTCDTDRSAIIALQRGKLSESHQAATIFIRSYQSTVKQTVTNLIAILVANSTIFS